MENFRLAVGVPEEDGSDAGDLIWVSWLK